MQSIVKRVLCVSAVLLAAACGEPAPDAGTLSAAAETAGDVASVSPAADAPAAVVEEAWYAIIPFEVAPENRERVAELSGMTVAPAQAAIGREMLQFFPAGYATSGYLILGRFDSAEDALAHSNPGQDQEFLAAYQAHMGEAGGAATAETMSMMTPGAAMIGRRTVTTPPVADGLTPDAAPVYYVAQLLDFTDEAAAGGAAIVGEDFGPIAESLGGEVMAFQLTGQEPWDWLIFTGRHESPDAAATAATTPVLRAGAAQDEDLAVVYRHPPE